MLYYGIGKYISLNSRQGFWGQGAIETISSQLERELPGLKGFSVRNLRYMRIFYEEWLILDSARGSAIEDKNSILAHVCAEMNDVDFNEIWHSQVPNLEGFPFGDYLSIGFTHHRVILSKVKNYEERMFYISECAHSKWGIRELEKMIDEDLYHHQGTLPNNFAQTMTPGMQAFKAVSTFKDE